MGESHPSMAFVCSNPDDETGAVITYGVDVAEQELDRLQSTPVENPSFLTVHPETNHLYVADRVSGGTVRGFRYDEDTGELAETGHRSSEGTAPCYLSVDATGNHLLVANYDGGSVAILPIEDDGTLGEATDVVVHEGSSVDPDRQQEPHPHSIQPGPENRFAYAPDLGTDRVMIYRLGLDDGTLEPAETPYASMHDGAGPRHMAFHPEFPRAYVINELDSTLTAFDYDPETGALDEVETASTLPSDVDDTNYPSEVHVHPSGRHLYGSNRGHDSIAIFDVAEPDARLSRLATESTHGEWPRHFAVHPSGDALFAENQHGDSIVSFDVDVELGRLQRWQSVEDVPEPMCMAFVEEN